MSDAPLTDKDVFAQNRRLRAERDRAEAEVRRLRAILHEFATQHPPIDPRTDRRLTFKQWVRGTADSVLRESATPASPPPARQEK